MSVEYAKQIKARATIDRHESLHGAMHWAFLHCFLDVGARFAPLTAFLAGFRIHPAQKVQSARHIGAREMATLRQRYAKRDVSFVETALRAAPHVLRRIWTADACRLGAPHTGLQRGLPA